MTREASARFAKWTALGALLVLVAPIMLYTAGAAAGSGKHMYMPAESMEPTIRKGDRFIAWTQPVSPLQRGDIVLVDAGGGRMYAKRIAALAGDRIEISAGVVILNGRPVAQRLSGHERRDDPTFPGPASRLREQFPGESSPHEIYDSGYGPFDDVPPQLVASDHVFVLGDDRDHSADSRVSRTMMGLEQVPIADVRGQPWFFTWTVDGDKWGARADH